jgi:hypothetical protein
MIKASVIRRLFITLIVIAIACFSTALSYKNYASEERQTAYKHHAQAEEALKQCRLERSDCSYSSSIAELGDDFIAISKKSEAVAFWWFLAAWISVAIMAGIPVITWIVTGSPLGFKKDPSPQ